MEYWDLFIIGGNWALAIYFFIKSIASWREGLGNIYFLGNAIYFFNYGRYVNLPL